MDQLLELSLEKSVARPPQDPGPGPLAAATRLCEARLARLNAQKRRQLAAERAARLEAQLQEAAEAGLRAEIARRIAVRGRLLAMQRVTLQTQAQRRAEEIAPGQPGACAVKPAGRITRFRHAAVATGLLVVTAAAVLALSEPAGGSFQSRAAPLAFEQESAGDGLRLSLSYTMREPPQR